MVFDFDFFVLAVKSESSIAVCRVSCQITVFVIEITLIADKSVGVRVNRRVRQVRVGLNLSVDFVGKSDAVAEAVIAEILLPSLRCINCFFGFNKAIERIVFNFYLGFFFKIFNFSLILIP